MLASSLLLAIVAVPQSFAQHEWSYGIQLSKENPSGDDVFGQGLDMEGQTIVAGAPRDDAAAFDAGAAFVFEQNGFDWVPDGTLLASDASEGASFGSSVAVWGQTIVVGAPDADHSGEDRAGAAYVYERSGDSWNEVAVLHAQTPNTLAWFGGAVAIHDDLIAIGGVQVAVGGGFPGAVHVYRRVSGIWGLEQILVGSGSGADQFGSSVDIEGETIAVGASWEYLGVGGAREGAAYVFEWDGSSWIEAGKLAADDGLDDDLFGDAIAVYGETVLVGAPCTDGVQTNQGTVYTFDKIGGLWVQTDSMQIAPKLNLRFGASLSLQGDAALIGNYDERPQLYERSGSSWTKLYVYSSPSSAPAGTTSFGRSVALDGIRALFGAQHEDYTIGTFEDVESLAVDPVGRVIYGVDRGTSRLLTIGVEGGATVLGTLPFGDIRGLAFDAGAGTMYASDAASGLLLVVDPAVVSSTAVGPIGFTQVHGLAFDSSTGTLFGTDLATNQLISIDTSNGAGTAVGALGFANVEGLAYDTQTNVLFGLNTPTEELIFIDRLTGAGTALNDVDKAGLTGLAYEPWAPRILASSTFYDYLYGIEQFGVNYLISFTAAIEESVNAGGVFVRTAWPADPCVGCTKYCSPGVSAAGCSAFIDAVGIADSANAYGFALTVAGAQGNRKGIFFFGTNGQQSLPWGNGASMQCVVPPVTRGSVQNSGGTALACDGTFIEDQNSLWFLQPQKNPGPGAVVQAQLWYRDPSSTTNKTSSMSNAIEFTVLP